MEGDAGGYDHIAHAVLGPVLTIVGATSLAGFLTVAADTLGLTIAVVTFLIGAVLATTAVAQKCPPNDLLSVDTYEGATTTETESTGKPRTW